MKTEWVDGAVEFVIEVDGKVDGVVVREDEMKLMWLMLLLLLLTGLLPKWGEDTLVQLMENTDIVMKEEEYTTDEDEVVEEDTAKLIWLMLPVLMLMVGLAMVMAIERRIKVTEGMKKGEDATDEDVMDE